MAELSRITLPSGTVYDLKDQGARDLIDALSGYTKFLGVTTTALTDGSTTNPITINGDSVTADTGSIATYGSEEFIWNGTAWQAFGDLSALGDLAYKDSASGSFTPAGTVSKPTFTGSQSSVAVTATANTNGNYQPAGTVSKPSFTGAAMTSTGKFTPAGSVGLTTSNKTATVSAASSGTATYTPAGSVSTPTITVTPSTTTIKNPTSQTVAKTLATAAPGATAPANAITYYSVVGETLNLYQIGYTTGASISTSDVSVVNGITSATSSQPTFTGTGARLVTGNIAVPTSASFTGDEGDVSVSGTTTGSVSQPTFTGTKVQLAGTTTAAGSVSQPTFTGTAGTVSVS